MQFSFIMPVYKTPQQLLRNAIDSILKPCAIDLELICVDDSPGEPSSAILAEYARKDTRVRVLTNDHNRGVSYSRNRGIDAARGEYIAFQDADDLAILEGGYQKLLQVAKKHDLDVVRGVAEGTFKVGVTTREKDEIFLTKAIQQKVDDLARIIAWESYSACVGIYKKSFVQRVQFDPLIRHYEDSIFNAKLIKRVQSIAIVNCLVYKVVGHPASASRKLPSSKVYLNSVLAAHALSRVISQAQKPHEKFIARYYAHRALHILFSDRRARYVLKTRYQRNAFVVGLCKTMPFIKSVLPWHFNCILKMITCYPSLLFEPTGLVWCAVKFLIPPPPPCLMQ